MEVRTLPRKLDTMLYADVATYSRLTELDEEGTHQTLATYLDILTAAVRDHGGRVVHFAGDAVLADFDSVIGALGCAAEVQQDLNSRNAELPEDRRVQFRIGINLGEVIVDRDDIYGDGVNVTARLEEMADPGGICISGAVRDAIGNRLPLAFEDLGERTVKNIGHPVRAYRVLLDSSQGKALPSTETASRPRKWIKAGVLSLPLLVMAGGLWYWNQGAQPDLGQTTYPVESAPTLPAKPSIAVLPFRNLSGDPEQVYFSDGITHDLVTDLSRFSELFVIASHSTLAYKGRSVDSTTVGRELGVRYVLQGTVQRAEGRVRVNAQLVDAVAGNHLWAERYDRELEDVFAVQDEIVRTIVRRLAVRIDQSERERALRKDTSNLAAYDYLLRAQEQRSKSTLSANLKARELLEKAIAYDDRYASAYAELGWCHFDIHNHGWTEFPQQAINRAQALARQALSLDASNVSALTLLGSTYVKWGQFELAKSALEQALALNPNEANAYARLGMVTLYSGQTAEAVDALETALRFNPAMPPNDFFNLGLAYYLEGRHGEAVSILERGIGRYPDTAFLHVALTAAYVRMGRSYDAAQSADAVRRLSPFFEADGFGSLFRHESDRAQIVEALRRAGF